MYYHKQQMYVYIIINITYANMCVIYDVPMTFISYHITNKKILFITLPRISLYKNVKTVRQFCRMKLKTHICMLIF